MSVTGPDKRFLQLRDQRGAFLVGQTPVRHRVERNLPHGGTPHWVADVSRDDVPVEVRHDVSERFDVHVIRLYDARHCLLRGEQIAGERAPFRAGQLIDAGHVPRVEDQLALPAIGLVLREVERRHR